jgi:tRNA(Ile)-lysidine synthetase-like protein
MGESPPQEEHSRKIRSILTPNNSPTSCKIAVSLSGGVDSMVLMHMYANLAYVDTPPEIVAVHINYNNRAESVEEANFLQEYCSAMKIKMIRHDINHIKRFEKGKNRSEYENETRDIRFDLYKKVVEDESVDGIYLAHHDGDVVENIFTNIMKNKHINDLSVLKKSNVISGVNIFRPLIGIKKNVIVDYASVHHIPYFKDSTPHWSCRGIMRNDIFPNCKKCYTESFEDNLMKLSNEITETHDVLQIMMKKYLGYQRIPPSSSDDTSQNILLDLTLSEDVLAFPVKFWKMLFDNICYELHIIRISKKAIDCFYVNISIDKQLQWTNRLFQLSNTVTVRKSLGRIYLKVIN